jgi:hypothetical protein
MCTSVMYANIPYFYSMEPLDSFKICMNQGHEDDIIIVFTLYEMQRTGEKRKTESSFRDASLTQDDWVFDSVSSVQAIARERRLQSNGMTRKQVTK